MNKKLQTSELIETVRLVAEHGVQKTATIQGITRQTVYNYVKRLEKQLGYEIFTPYDYGRMSWQGREFLRGEENEI